MSETHDYEDRHFDADVYDKAYFEGNSGKSGYGSYLDAKGIVQDQFNMIDDIMRDRIGEKTVLEVACAYGYGMQRLEERGWKAHGFDISEWAISQAAHPNAVVGDALHSDTWDKYKTGQFSLSVAVEFFEHIESDDVDTIIEELARVSDWGFYVVNGRTSPDQDVMSIHGDHGHLNNHNMSWWIKQFAEYGDIDWDAMFEFNKRAEAYNKDVHWHNRCIIVKYR